MGSNPGLRVAALAALGLAAFPALAGAKLTSSERRALTIKSVHASGTEGAGLIVGVTFAGNIEKALGQGDLKHALVAVVLEPNTPGVTAAGVATEGAGPLGQVLSQTRSNQLGVVRDGRELFFVIIGAGSSHVGRIAVKAFANSPPVRARAAAEPISFWNSVADDAAQSELQISYLDKVLATSNLQSCSDAMQLESQADQIAADVKREIALLEHAGRGVDAEIKLIEPRVGTGAKVRTALLQGLLAPAGLSFTYYSGGETPANAFLSDKAALRGLRLDSKLVDAYAEKFRALERRLLALKAKFHSLVEVWCGIPELSPVHAVFTAAPSGQPCNPPACTTVYTESVAPNSYGGPLTYSWSVSIPQDPDCAKGFTPNQPVESRATWYHADASQGGSCNHGGSDYNASGSGHPGTVTVVVTNDYWSCTATYYGTQGANGQPTGDGPAPEACQPVKY